MGEALFIASSSRGRAQLRELMRAAARRTILSWPRADRGQPITAVSIVKERVQLCAPSTLTVTRIDFSNYFWPPWENSCVGWVLPHPP